MLRVKLLVIAGKSGPITTPRFSPLGGEPAMTALNQSNAGGGSSRQRTTLNPACSSAVRVSASLRRKLDEATRAQGAGHTNSPHRSTKARVAKPQPGARV